MTKDERIRELEDKVDRLLRVVEKLSEQQRYYAYPYPTIYVQPHPMPWVNPWYYSTSTVASGSLNEGSGGYITNGNNSGNIQVTFTDTKSELEEGKEDGQS